MRRRDFIQLIAGSAAMRPFSLRAQQTLPVIGYLSARSAEAEGPMLAAFRQGLAETGFDLDREWMVVDASGSFVTQRELPIRSVLIWSRLNFAALE